MTQKKFRFRTRANRYGFTINNPFVTESIKTLDRNNLTDEQKEILQQNRHDYSHLKVPQYERYLDFVLVEYFVNEIKDRNDTAKKIVAERIFFKDYDSAKEYFKQFDFIDYFCFQYEIGASGTKHLQGFLHFSRPMDMGVVHDIFPTMHLQRCSGSNGENRDYCRKSDTKIEGFDFYEWGVLVEERQRTDIDDFKEAIQKGASTTDLFNQFPRLTLTSYGKIGQLQQDILREKFEDAERAVYTTYIYGKPNAGKTTYPKRVLGYKSSEIGKISDYASGKFDDYKSQDIILFDEFTGQIPITTMNDLLDTQPLSLPARYANKVACYTKVFIISNYSLANQYKLERQSGRLDSYEGFMRRIHEVIYMPRRNHYIWQRGKPTEKATQTILEQGATYEIEEELK